MIWHDVNWWLLFLIPVFWVFQNFLHEISHAMVISAYGWTYRIYPIFHWYNLDTKETRYGFSRPKDGDRWKLYAARIDYIQLPGCKILTDENWKFVHIAPRVSNSLFVFFSYVFYMVLIEHSAGHTLLMLFFFFNCVDAVVGWIPIFCWWEDRTLSDIWRFHKRAGWSKRKTQIVAIAWSVVAVFLFFFPMKSFFH